MGRSLLAVGDDDGQVVHVQFSIYLKGRAAERERIGELAGIDEFGGM